MKMSPNTRYAIRVLFELHGLSAPVSTAWLSEKTGIALRAVENIQAVLKRAGITSGTVGARGGLRLERTLAQISLGELVRLFDGGIAFAVCCGEKSNECPNQGQCGIRAAWDVVSDQIQRQLDGITLLSILERYPAEPDGSGFILNKFLADDADQYPFNDMALTGELTMKEMRQAKRRMSDEESLNLLHRGEYGVLATVGPDGAPYGVPLSYVYLNGKVYLHCAHEGQKIDNIRADARVTYTVVGATQPVYAKNYTTWYESVIVFGTVQEVTDLEEKSASLYALAQKYLPEHMDGAEEAIRASLARTAVYAIIPSAISGKHKQPH